MRSGLLLVVVCGALVSGWAEAQAHSSCSGDAKLVCGADGTTFLNACLAQAQGVEVASDGQCSDVVAAAAAVGAVAQAVPDAGPGTSLKGCPAALSPSQPARTLAAATIGRFSADGLRLTALAPEGAFAPDVPSFQVPRKRRVRAAAGAGAAAAASAAAAQVAPGTLRGGPRGLVVPPATPQGALAVRKTADGLVYQLAGDAASEQLRAAVVAAAAALAKDDAAVAAALEAVGGASAAGRAPSGAGGAKERGVARDGGRRLLTVIGGDERKEMANGPGWPLSAVGQLSFGKGSCSGVMVGPRSVLTAAQCVYSRTAKIWQDKITFTPYRHRVKGKDTWPIGRVGYTHVTTYLGFLEAEDSANALSYDMALVQLTDDVGNSTGWMGMTYSPKGFRGLVQTAGYPGDKVLGSLWRTTCRVTDLVSTDASFVSMCDMYAGQAGSPMWTQPDASAAPQLRAIMAYESCRCCNPKCTCCTGRSNGGIAINAMNFASIQAWQ